MATKKAAKPTPKAKARPKVKSTDGYSIRTKRNAKEVKEEERWRTQSALETLQHADEVKKDKGLMSKVKTLANQMQNVVKGE